MTVGTVLSRATGVIRLASIAAALGVTETRVADAYNLANTAPNIIYELVLGGVLTSVFVPVFVELLENEGRERAWEVASAVINLSLITLSAIAALGIVFAPWIADLYSSRLSGTEAVLQHRVLTDLLRLFIPQIIFYGLAAIATGLLNAHRRFGPPMYTPVLNNLAVTAVFIAYALAFGVTDLSDVTSGQILLMGLGTTSGVVLMAVAQLPFLKGLGRYRWTLSAAHPSVRKLARLSVFVIGYVVVNQLGYLIVQYLAAKQQGGYTAYTYAFMFFQLPHGLFAVSIITALLPRMSAEAVRENWSEYRARLSTGIRSTFMLILPASVGYFVLAEPIVRLLLEHGVAGRASTALVASVLRVFVVGLVPFSIFQLLLRAHYAVHNTKTPFYVNCVAVALNTAANFALFGAFQAQGLAAGFVLAYFVGVIIQGRYLARRVGGIAGRRIAASGIRIAAASGGMGAAVWGAARLVGAYGDGANLAIDLLHVVVPVAVGVAAFTGLALALRVQELEFVTSLLRRRAQSAPGTGR
jgi:putative peptidoglycan lipid II flippase